MSGDTALNRRNRKTRKRYKPWFEANTDAENKEVKQIVWSKPFFYHPEARESTSWVFKYNFGVRSPTDDNKAYCNAQGPEGCHKAIPIKAGNHIKLY